MASPPIRDVWVRLKSAGAGDEVRVEVGRDGVIEDLLRAALSALELPREGLRVNSLRAFTEGGERLPNRARLASVHEDAVVVLEVHEPFAPPARTPHRSSSAEGAPERTAAAAAAGTEAAARGVAPPGGGPMRAAAEVAAAPRGAAASSPALRRMMRELKLVQTDPSWGVSAAPVSDSELFTWHCNVAGHPPGGGAPVVLHMELTFPEDYPTRPPKVEVLGSTVRHPNVFSTFICLDMLEGGEWASDEEKRRPYCGWSSAYSILAILRQLQTFFFEGDGTKWWDCPRCTLRNPISRRRCDACEQPRGQLREVTIDVVHHPGFACRCGHKHAGEAWPPFPDPVECDDAPVVMRLPDHPEDICVICLGHVVDAPQHGPLRGALGARPLAQLVSRDGSDACKHWFHLPCICQLLVKECPLCRAPFDHAVERKCEGPASSALLRGSPRPEALCDEARDRMARLADWPSGVVVALMSFLRRPERSTLGGAVPVWREAAQAPIFWEAQELECFHEKTGPGEDVVGIGVNAEGRGKLAKLTAHFDAVSLTAWQGGLRRAAWKEPMSHWLPLFVDAVHARKAAPLFGESLALWAECAASGADSHLPPPVFESLARAGVPPEAVNAVTVLPEMMHQLLKQVLDGDRHASSKLLKGYFVLHRLFLHFCDEWPAIREAADAAVQGFASSPEQRTKAATPWIAYILQLLTVSDVGWDEVREQFVEEVLARQVQFTRASFPNYRPVDPDAAAEGPAEEEEENPLGEWQLSEREHGSERDPGTAGAQALGSGEWLGRPRGWACLAGAPRAAGGRHAFSARLERLPEDAVCRIGWATGEDCNPFDGWFCYGDGGCFGQGCWKSDSRTSMIPYGARFREGDLLTACVDRGRISFRRNGDDLGVAFWGPPAAEFRPVVALRRGARVRLLAADVEAEAHFATPEDLRNMAWESRLGRRGMKLVLFQVFFLSLVRPRGEGPSRWDELKREYDRRLGFPAPAKSAALMQHFGEVHRVVSLRGSEAWPLFFRMLGLEAFSAQELDRRLFAAYQRATALGYRMGGRHDHA